MLAVARRTTEADLRSKVVWLLGSDADLPSVCSLIGAHGLRAITIAQALHFMDSRRCSTMPRASCGPGAEWP